MIAFVSRHRAAFGLLSVLAFAALPVFSEWPVVAIVAVAALFFIGLLGLAGSPYRAILYREGPLQRAMTGVTDLDEREAALRDRANGLTYFLFVVVNLLLIGAAALAARAGWRGLDGDFLTRALISYTYFAVALPVIMLEWFEPSDLWAQPANDEEE